MATLKAFKVTLLPATKTEYGHQIALSIGGGAPFRIIEANTLDEAAAAVKAYALDHGKGCYASVSVHPRTARKPSGFDKVFNGSTNAWCFNT